ncbi:hypothetical protein [Streptomyces chitinivorans]|uniref:hypothetical protein n=1 Tax=Streptomyces chitinivorans TaxID=1257027 RepID=UPI00244C82AD|nr:hypothetical protein [Streptomyces chitinivorans]MDH2412029.1 hypothetical protein [Streptomyces chitinivorans]
MAWAGACTGRPCPGRSRGGPAAERVIAFTDRLTRAVTARSLPVRAGRDVTLRLLGHIPAWRTRLAAELAGLHP